MDSSTKALRDITKPEGFEHAAIAWLSRKINAVGGKLTRRSFLKSYVVGVVASTTNPSSVTANLANEISVAVAYRHFK